jgi:predicted transcriptional regulator
MEKILSPEEIKKELEPFNLSHVARVTGVNRVTIWNLFQGKGVQYTTLKKLSAFIQNYKAG